MSAARRSEPELDGQGKNLTILEHLNELRTRLMICAGAIVLAGLLSLFFLTTYVIKLLKRPAEAHVGNFDLVFTKPLEYWTTYFDVSLDLAIAFAMPVLVWQLFAFVGPGLTRREKRWAYPLVLGASALFLLGCAFAYFVEMPPALRFLLGANSGIARPLISVQSYVDFATKMLMVTGFVFETPLIVMGLAKIGIVHSRMLLHWWRFAILGAFVVSAVVTPSIDPVTQTLVAAPMVVLYFFGALLAKLVEGNPIIPRN